MEKSGAATLVIFGFSGKKGSHTHQSGSLLLKPLVINAVSE
jgi:hypothetical protein